MRKVRPLVLVVAALVLAPACGILGPQPGVSLVNHVEGAGIWTDERPRIEARALGAERVVFRVNGESRTDTQPPFELDTTTLPSGAVPFTVEAYFPNGEVATIDSGVYVKDPGSVCDISTLIEPRSQSELESLISPRTDAVWAPKAPPELRPDVILTALDPESFSQAQNYAIGVLKRVDRGFLDVTDAVYLVESIMFNGTSIAGLNDPGGRQIAIKDRPSDREKFTHTLISENATLQSYPRLAVGSAESEWDATNPNGYSSLTFEEYLQAGGSGRLVELDTDLLKRDNFVNAYAARNRYEDLSQFSAALFLHPERMLYFASTSPHTGEKIAAYDEMFSNTNMGIDYVECLAHER